MTLNETQIIKTSNKINIIEDDLKVIRLSRDKLGQSLNDVNTSLDLHKDLIYTFINSNIDSTGLLSNSYKDNLELVIVANKQALMKFATYQQEKVENTKTLNIIMHAISNRPKEIEQSIKHYKEINACLQKKISSKMIEMERKVKDHDKLVESKDIEFIEKYIHHYPTKQNVELFNEKVQCNEILTKLMEIIKNEKLKYAENQNKIRELIVEVSKSKRKKRNNYTTIVDDSYAKAYCSTIPCGTLDNSLGEEGENEGWATDNCNNLNLTLDSNFIQFPDKIHLRTISSHGMGINCKEIPKLDFKPIKFKYKYESSGFAIKKVDEIKMKEKPDDYSKNIKSLLQNDYYDDEGINKLKLEIKESQAQIYRLKEDLLYWKDGLRINTIQTAKLDDSIDEANMKIYRLENLIIELNRASKGDGHQDLSNANENE